MSKEPLDPWASAMLKVGATDPRNGRPSWTRLADLAGVSPSTVTGMIEGRRSTSAATVQKVAKALRLDASKVSEWLGMDRVVDVPYMPPPEADLLTMRQRKALDELIRAFTSEQEGGGSGDSGSPATKLPAPGPANQPGKQYPQLIDEAAYNPDEK